LYWGYIVTFTKVLTIYHSWIYPICHSPLSPAPHSWNSFNRSHFSFCTYGYIILLPYSPSSTLSFYSGRSHCLLSLDLSQANPTPLQAHSLPGAGAFHCECACVYWLSVCGERWLERVAGYGGTESLCSKCSKHEECCLSPLHYLFFSDPKCVSLWKGVDFLSSRISVWKFCFK
jgi:hypothetical protein